jgi:TolB-like protein/Flp pilus assembly protein TadD
VPPDARQKPPSSKRRAGGKHVLPNSFYGNGGTKFPKFTTGDGLSLVALFRTFSSHAHPSRIAGVNERFVKARRVNPPKFLTELKRRNVYRAAVAYGVVAWFLAQLTTQVFPFFEIPNSAVRFVVIALAAGFPIAMLLSWVYEFTPEGVVRTEDLQPAQARSVQRATGRILDFIIIGALLLVIAMLIVGRFPFYRETGELISQKSVAVLPFENLSRDPDNAYFAEGIKEEVLARLSKVEDLKVISIRSTPQSKSSLTDLSQIAQKLGVGTFLEGSVQRSADEVRVTVQLVRAETDAHLWADVYDRKLTDIFAVETEIAKAVADTLQAKLTGSEERAISVKPTGSLEAYEFYLRGRYYWNRRTAGGFKKALEQFEQAVEKDPTYGLAYAGLADCYALLEQYVGTPSSETLPKARAAALRALQIDDSLGEAHTSLGYVNGLSWQFREAEKEFKRGIALNPNYPTAHHWYGLPYLAMLGRLEEAMAEIKRAQRLDPLSPIISANAGNLYVLEGNLNTAIEEFKKVIELDPNFPIAHDFLGCAYLKQGREQEAMAELQKGVELSRRASQELGFLGYGYGAIGKRAEATTLLKELEERYARKESPAMFLAAVYAGLGEKDQAFAWLERDFQARTGLLIFITTLPDYDALRDDPRYIDLLRRIGLRP